MKRNFTHKLHQQTLPQLQLELLQAQKQLAELQLKLKAGKAKDLTIARKKRREIALIKTILRQKDLALQAERKNVTKPPPQPAQK